MANSSSEDESDTLPERPTKIQPYQLEPVRQDFERVPEHRVSFEANSMRYYYYYLSLLYSAILRSRADSLRSHVILHECIAFYSAFLNIHWCHKNLLPERVNLGTFCVHHTTMHRVTSCKATYVRCMRV